MTRDTPSGLHHIAGGGIAGLAAAVFLIRDAGTRGEDIRIYDAAEVAGGSLDASGGPDAGYLVRGGRMFEPHFACTLDLLGSIPSADDPAVSAAEDIFAFNRAVPGSGKCRLVRDGRPAPDRAELSLRMMDKLDIARLTLVPEAALGARRIEDWFRPSFFDSNFWLMWSTMFAFQPWHSAAEMRRYLKRFIHLFPGFTRIEGILRTRYNQYDSMILPVQRWLEARGVRIETGTAIADLRFAGSPGSRRATDLVLDDGTAVPLGADDKVYLTLGSMTDGAVLGSNDAAPGQEDREGPSWRLWRNLAAAEPGFGRPEAFCGDPRLSAWNSFTVTMEDPGFFAFMEAHTGNRTGTGGLVTFAGSGWVLSIVLFHQPHFRGQAPGKQVFWGYGLRGDRPGDFVRKPMWEATGDEIAAELCGQLHLSEDQAGWFRNARIRPCRMPFITSQFMPRRPGDRPLVCPPDIGNVAVMGQFCEQERDCVFTVEYSVRAARAAVAGLTGRCTPPPPVARTDLDPRVLMRAAGVFLRG
ncbi:oleate hydratase [Mangrovicoccus sp. HB161399]|uniref:oleate hydratase n=1 Tax=Mangrovicoccus sp. HB161399 TaxID=2720392 RepID=UPI0015581A08|nr:oleate hydratase [Mangrovicoccus sp. HB161399]